MNKWLLNTIGCCIIAALGFASWGGFAVYPHVTGMLDAWRDAADVKASVQLINATLEFISRPCASVDAKGHLMQDGPICELNTLIHDVRKITTASGKQVQQTGKLIDATTQTMGEAGAAVKDTAGHFNKTADAATRFIDTLTIDGQTANRLLEELRPLIASYTATGNDLDATIKTANGIMASPSVTIMLDNGAQFTTTAVELEQKLAKCTLHPTLSCVLKSDILFGAQVGGYLLR